MMRRGLEKISQLVKASLAQQPASLEIFSSSKIIGPNQGALSVPSSINNWYLHSWRLYSSETGGDGAPSGSDATNSAQLAGGKLPVPVKSAAVSSPLEADVALDAWGDAMDKG